jgi:hypothetical protein
VGQELISGATMSNPDLQPLSDALKTLNKTTKPKELVNTATGVVNVAKGINSLWQAPGKAVRGIVKVLTFGLV